MFESRISAGATENYQGGKNLTQRQKHASIVGVKQAEYWREARQPETAIEVQNNAMHDRNSD